MPKEQKTFLYANKANGFHLKFSNGNTVSVQWGPGSFTNMEITDSIDDRSYLSSTAEIAAWDSERNWHYFKDGNTVQGYTSVDEVAYFIGWVSTHTLNTKDPLKEIEEHEHV